MEGEVEIEGVSEGDVLGMELGSFDIEGDSEGWLLGMPLNEGRLLYDGCSLGCSLVRTVANLEILRNVRWLYFKGRRKQRLLVTWLGPISHAHDFYLPTNLDSLRGANLGIDSAPSSVRW